jgi:two-component sensor histidine kinase
MQLGYELVREQILFRRELRERVFWFIKLRWLAIAAAFGGNWAACVLDQPLPFVPLNSVLAFIALYNVVFFFVGKRLESAIPQRPGPFFLFAHVQIALDLLALFVVVYLTGGIHSPLALLVVLHIVLAGILLSETSCYAYGLSVIAALAALILLEGSRLLPAHPVPGGRPGPEAGSGDPWVPFFALAAAVLASAFLIATVAASLRIKGRELLAVSAQLDSSNTKLTALYRMVREMGRCTELKALMDLATGQAALIMGVKACSIKLLDESGRQLRFASTYGLSQDYVSKGAVDIDKSPINQKIVQGSLYAIGSIDEKDYFQYPEEIAKEGIASMLCLPLKVEKMILGVFCVYSDETYHFGDPDVEFFSLMTDLTAASLEKLKAEITKSWFMNKAAHQLRSPLNAVHSMVRIVRDGHLGPVADRQAETLARCEKRIEMLGELIGDLLKLGQGRAHSARVALHPVDLRAVMAQVMPLYQSRAEDKGVEIAFEIQEPLPDVLGDEEMVDELFTNLISNAVRYTPAGGRVKVVLAKEGRHAIRFEVSDTGIGIPEQDISRLFTEFFRAENAKAWEEKGTGLGLVIVKEVLDRLKGTIQVRSRAGEGATFTCLIPSILHP